MNADGNVPTYDRVFEMATDISCFFVDTFCQLPVEPILGRVVKPVSEAYENFEMQWKFTH